LVVFGATALSFVFLAMGYAFQDALYAALHIPSEIEAQFSQYWNIYLLALPFSYFFSVTAAVFRARKLVMVPLSTGAVVCIVNAIGDFGLGFGLWGLPELGGAGLAWSTCFAGFIGAAGNLFFMRRFRLLDKNLFPARRWVRVAAPYLLKVALPTGAMQALWQVGFLMLYVIVGTLPQDSVYALAGLSAGMRVESILFLPALAFNMTASVLVGHFLGAGQKEEAKRVGLRIIIAGCVSMSIFAALLWPWMRPIAGWINPDPAALEYIIAYLRVNLVSIPFTVGSMILSGIMIGAGSTIYSFVINGSSVWLLRLPLAWALGHYWNYGAQGVFLAMLVSQAVQSSSLFWVFMKCDWSRFSMRHHRHGQDRKEFAR